MRILPLAWAALVLVAGCDAMQAPPRPLAKTATFDLYVVAPAETPTTQRAIDPATRTPLHLLTPALLSAADVATIQRSQDAAGQPALTVNLTPAGAGKLAAATAKPAGMQVAIVANGTVLAAPKVMSPISTSFQLSGPEIAARPEQWFESLTKD